MPIRFDNQAAAGMVGAFAAGMGRGDERRRREQLALIERQRERLFQVGMQQQQLGARVQLQNAGFANDLALQQARFGQQQQMNQQEFQQHQLLQEAGFANQARLQQAGFGNQRELQTQEALDRERLFGQRSEQDLIEAAHKDIREGRSILSPDNRSQLNYVRELRDATIRDPNIPEDQRRFKLNQLRQAEARILTTAEPAPKPPMPNWQDHVQWPGGVPGQGVGLIYDPKKGSFTPHDFGTKAEQEQRKQEAAKQQRISETELKIAQQDAALQTKVNPSTQKPYTEEERAGILQGQRDYLAALKESQTSRVSDPMAKSTWKTQTAPPQQAPASMTAPVGTQGANAAAQTAPPQGRVEVGPGVYANFGGTTPVPPNAPYPRDAEGYYLLQTTDDVNKVPPGSNFKLFVGKQQVGGGSTPTPKPPVPVQTQADIQALPNGAQWVAPDGQTGSVQKTTAPGTVMSPDGKYIWNGSQWVEK